MQALKPGFVYFLLVFGTGFVLGTIRVLFIVPLVGHRTAELIEMPLMLIATVLAAQWTIRRFPEPRNHKARLAIGGIALGLMLAGELAVGIGLRGMTPAEVFLNRDPVSGTAYYVSLILFAVMPWLVSRR
ncbi:hypothetical protein YTPLAS72_10360 [Nitrospira sp.]|nr:hypothetical protein YTPLAS72_10360 [Nitrospira sp.]